MTGTNKTVTPEEVQNILSALLEIMKGNFEHRLPVQDPFDPIDAIHLAINTTAEEISNRTVSKEYAENILQSMDDMLIVFDANARIINVNQATCKVLGYNPTDLIDRKIGYIVDRDSVFKNGVTIASHQSWANNTTRDIEVILNAKDGSRIPLVTNVSALRSTDGDLQSIILVGRDMRRIRRLIKEAEHASTAAAVIEGMVESIIITDLDAKIIAANSEFEKGTGYNREEIIGKEISDLNVLSDSDSEGIKHVLLPQLSKKGVITNIESNIRNKNGTEFPASTNWVLLRDTNGEPVNIIIVSRDITARKQAEREREDLEIQLRQSQKMEAIGMLAGGIAHDMNNILGAITGSASVLESELDQDSPSQQDITNILTACRKGMNLTRNLLGFARKGKYVRERVALNKVIEETEILLERTSQKKATIRIHLDDTLDDIEGDSSQIAHALMNICINAFDAMQGQGELTISTKNIELTKTQDTTSRESKSANYVKVEVTDTGMGMDSKVVERVFEPFFTTKPKGKGTGLGLSMVYGTIKNHGGTIAIESKIGVGTTVTLLLPAIENCAHPAAVKPETKKPSLRPKTGSILLVDDESIIRNSTRRLLERLGYKVLLAENGLKALEIYKKHQKQISLVILDLIMPDMDGTETLTNLLKIDKDAKVLICSGYSKDESLIGVLAENTLGFLQKPFDLGKLSEEIAKALK